MIPAIIGAFKDDEVRKEKELTKRHEITVNGEVLKLKVTTEGQVEEQKIKLEQRRAEIASEEAQQIQQNSHELKLEKGKNLLKEKEFAKELEVRKLDVELKIEELKKDVELAHVDLEKHKCNLEHGLAMKQLEHEGEKTKQLCSLMDTQARLGISGPAYAYNGMVMKHLLHGEVGTTSDLLNNLGHLNRQMVLEEGSTGREREAALK